MRSGARYWGFPSSSETKRRCQATLRCFPVICRLAGAADGQRIDAQSGLADSDRHRLAFLPACPHPTVQLQIVADHADALQDIGAVADQSRTLDRRADLAVLDHVSFARREHEFAGRDVDLPT